MRGPGNIFSLSADYQTCSHYTECSDCDIWQKRHVQLKTNAYTYITIYTLPPLSILYILLSVS